MADDVPELDREGLILGMVQRLRSLSDKAATNGNLSSAIQACVREADLLLSLSPEKPAGPGGVIVRIEGDDAGLVSGSAHSEVVAKLERIAKREAENERMTGRCSRCGGPIGERGVIELQALPSNQSAQETCGEAIPGPNPPVPPKPVLKSKPWKDWAQFDGNGNRVDSYAGYAERNGESFDIDPLVM